MKSLENMPLVLSFEEFTRVDPETGTPRFNNFFAHFLADEFFGRIYREKPYYEQFAKEHPGVAVDLARKIEESDMKSGVVKALKPLEEDLYKAYTLMKGYGASDEELFN